MSEKTAVIYARVSTTRQADDGLPVAGQIERGHIKASSLEAIVVREFVDAGISGRTDSRPAFQDAVAYCKAFQVDYFICWSTSRFARNKLDAAMHKRDLEKTGCRVVYVSVDIDNRTDSGWMTESILEIFDEHYSRQVSTDTLRSMMKNARDGYFNGGRVPFGYRTVTEGKRKKLAIEPADAEIVRDAFQWCAEGHGAKIIAMRLNEQGRLHRTTEWQKNTIGYILKSWCYAGYTIFNRKNGLTGKERPMEDWIMTDSHEGIVSKEVFMNVQNIMEGRAPTEGSGSPRSNFVFTGMLKCGICGSAMQMESARGNGGKYRYYNCSAALRGKNCESRRIPAAELDAWLIDSIMDRILTRERIEEFINELHDLTGEWVKGRAKRRQSIVAAMTDVEKRQKKLFEVLELHGKDAPNLGDLTIRMRELRSQRDDLERSLIQLEEEESPHIDVDQDQIEEMAEILREIVSTSEDPKKQRLFFAGFINEIVLGDQEARIVYDPGKIVNRTGTDVVHSKNNWLPDLDSNQGPAD
ncbi:MAG: recombinase family protein [Gammaproteobacteria bacterium]|nr:recombinase family protein [Gammaproteobacteria bacterium]MBU1730997.1 recombinase family protein [Gammaproteobacteria bacterium]MBU1893657.1 recombinase family protein [Gammaproteobacteria bacterium]